MGASTFAWRVLQYLCAFSILIALIRIALSETPFSKTLTVCLWWIGGLFIAASVIFTRLPGYVTSGFRLFYQRRLLHWWMPDFCCRGFCL